MCGIGAADPVDRVEGWLESAGRPRHEARGHKDGAALRAVAGRTRPGGEGVCDGPASSDAGPGAHAVRHRSRLGSGSHAPGSGSHRDHNQGIDRPTRRSRNVASKCCAGPRRYVDDFCRRAGRLLSANSRRPCRGGIANKRPLFSLAGGGQPEAHRCVGPMAFRSHSDGARQSYARGGRSCRHPRHWQHGYRRPVASARKACRRPRTPFGA